MDILTFNNLPEAITLLLEEVKGIKELLKNHKQAEQPDEIMTIEEAATFTKLTKTTIYSKVSDGTIPSNKRGGRLYFSKDELTNWIKGGKKKTIWDIEAQAAEYIKGKRNEL
jgi:excisionase family DNA binding protein